MFELIHSTVLLYITTNTYCTIVKMLLSSELWTLIQPLFIRFFFELLVATGFFRLLRWIPGPPSCRTVGLRSLKSWDGGLNKTGKNNSAGIVPPPNLNDCSYIE